MFHAQGEAGWSEDRVRLGVECSKEGDLIYDAVELIDDARVELKVN